MAPDKKPFTQQSRPQGQNTSFGQHRAPGQNAAAGSRPGGSQSRPQGTQSRPQSGAVRPQGMQSRPQGGQNRFQGQKENRMVYINDMIKAPKILLIDEQGEKIGMMSRDEALRRASNQGLDLVQLAYNAAEMICTAKIVDYGKYMYEKQKDEREKKKTQKTKGGKDIKMSYTIGDNDLALKVQKAEEFLDDGYTVRFIVRLKGREKIFVTKVVERMKTIEQTLAEKGKSQGVKEEPNGISLFLLPKSK